MPGQSTKVTKSLGTFSRDMTKRLYPNPPQVFPFPHQTDLYLGSTLSSTLIGPEQQWIAHAYVQTAIPATQNDFFFEKHQKRHNEHQLSMRQEYHHPCPCKPLRTLTLVGKTSQVAEDSIIMSIYCPAHLLSDQPRSLINVYRAYSRWVYFSAILLLCLESL